MVAGDLDPAVLDAWQIPLSLNVGPFSDLQASFLEYPRTHVFRVSRQP
jgi:hypothetical protein